MFFIIAEYVSKLYVNVFQVVKLIPDIEVGIIEEWNKWDEWDIKIPEYFSSQDELDKLV